MRRILFVVPSISSCEAFLTELFSALVRSGVEVHVAASTQRVGDERGKLPEGVRLHPCNIPRGASPWRLFKSLLQALRLTHQLKPDLVHGHFIVGALLAAVVARFYRRYSVVTFHGLHGTQSLKAGVVSLLEQVCCRLATQVEVLTGDDAAWLQQRGVPATKIEALGLPGMGCRIDRLDPANLDLAESIRLKKSLGIQESTAVFVYIGRLVDFKGYATAVRAFRRLNDEGVDACLIVVGPEDPLHSDGLTDPEREWARSCSQLYHVGWKADVAEWLGLARAFIFPSVREGIPVSVMEAMASGITPVVVDTRGCRELVEDGVTGLVLASQDATLFAGAMRRLTQDPVFASKLGSQARVRALDCYSRGSFVEAQQARYRQYTRPR